MAERKIDVRDTLIGCFLYASTPGLGMEPAIKLCNLDWNLTQNPPVHGRMLYPLSDTSEGTRFNFREKKPSIFSCLGITEKLRRAC